MAYKKYEYRPNAFTVIKVKADSKKNAAARFRLMGYKDCTESRVIISKANSPQTKIFE